MDTKLKFGDIWGVSIYYIEVVFCIFRICQGLPGPARVCISINYEVKMDRRKCDQGISYAQVRALSAQCGKIAALSAVKIQI